MERVFTAKKLNVEHLHSLELALLNWLHGNLPPGLVPVLQLVSDTTTWVSIGGMAAVLGWSFYRKSKTLRTKFFLLLLVLLLTAGITRTVKTLVDRDRPFTTYPEIKKLSTGGDSSFPSGHTLEAFGMATAAAFLFRRRGVTATAFCWALIVAWSRMALGVHYPSDVLAGMVLGGLTGWLVTHFARARFRFDQDPAG